MPSLRDILFFGLASSGLVLPAAIPARAAPTERDVDVRKPTLSEALSDLARQANVEMLFDEDLVRGLRAPAVRGRMTLEAALSRLLMGTGLSFRTSADGAIIIFVPNASEPTQADDGAISEILVIGRRTQNVDIRRTQNDIQGYKVATAREILASHRDGVDSYLRSRVPSNADIQAPIQNVQQMAGTTNSRVDLRGIGAQRTLVLIDGRRIPALPSTINDFDQGDLNGVPLGAIDRIETLTSTAGGVYGPGAIGGVVNVILRRDYRGADFTVTSGITDRADAAHLRLEGRIGFTPDGGATDVMLFGSYAVSERLRYGQRDYMERARRRSFGNNPGSYLAPSGLPVSNAVLVQSVTGMPLSFDAELGGAPLNSSFTYLPLDFQGSDADRRGALIANAGTIELDPPNTYAGNKRSLLNNPVVKSLLVNVRHRFGANVEAFLDGFYFSNHGEAQVAPDFPSVITRPDALNNPFAQDVSFRFPTEGGGAQRVNNDVYRVVGGVIVGLPAQWRGEMEFAIGAARSRADLIEATQSNAFMASLSTGALGSGGEPPLMPLGDWTAMQSALRAYQAVQSVEYALTNHFYDAALRLAGPLVKLPGGPLTLTLLAEQRRDHLPAGRVTQTLLNLGFTIMTAERTQRVRSAYAELRAPLAPMTSGLFMLRGLELSLAMRLDSIKTIFPRNTNFGQPTNDDLISARRDALMYTVGARTYPLPVLMLRGSFATGQVPPTIGQLQTREQVVTAAQNFAQDPRRGGEKVGLNGFYTLARAGSANIRQERGSTVSLGFVVNPESRGGPRLSVDYSKIVARKEIIAFPLQQSDLLAQEAAYPDRVIRAPLTDQDRANGFTGGPIMFIDLRARNTGRTVVRSVDIQIDWRISDMLDGQLSPYLRATWQPSIRTRTQAGQPSVNRIGYADGPLAWRGNAGVEWQRGSTSIDLNAQYFHHYRITRVVGATAETNADAILSQGRLHVPAQVYVDLSAAHLFEIESGGPGSSIEVRMGIQNLFDHSPPIVAYPSSVNYSSYGDPRRRRAELAVTAKF